MSVVFGRRVATGDQKSLGVGNIKCMEEYRHTQIGYTILSFFGVAIVLVLFATPQNNSSLAVAILIIISALFCTLTIKINEGTIHWYFGPYFWKKKIKISEIVRTEIVHSSWWCGWGIRRIKHGWLYNVSGFNAVQLELKSGKRIRLGTDQPGSLKVAIDGEIEKHLTTQSTGRKIRLF